MTKEEIIDNIARLNSETWKDREEVRTEIGKLLAELKKALEQQPSDDCISRKAVFETIDDCNSDGLKGIFCSYEDSERFKEYIKKLPPVTPTQCIASIRFNKEELRDICNERIEIACQHGTCKDCKHLCDLHNGRIKDLYCGLHTGEDFCFEVEENFYCAYFEGACKNCRAWSPRGGDNGFCRRSPHRCKANESCENFERRKEE